jgi:hypothetical protein
MLPSKSLVVSATGGEDLPIEVVNKTVRELKKMGFKDLINVDMKMGKGGMKPELSEFDRRRLLKNLKEMEEGDSDPLFYLDKLGE